jgi:DNA-binding transcriptional regulator YhcF (GntR family)
VATGAKEQILAELRKSRVLSARQLAEACGLAVTTVQHGLADLRKDGVVHRQGGQPCRYALDPAHFWLGLPPPPAGFS